MANEEIDEVNDQKIINEEYKIWKKNSPFLYDLILSTALEWPSLTVQWLPDKKVIKDDNIDYSVERLILGTHTNDNETNHLIIAEVRLPTPDPKLLQEKYEESCDVYGGFGGAAGKIEIIQRIIHDGEVNRARYMPQNANIIATKTKHGDIYIFDRTKHASKPINGNKCKPNMILKGHDKEGYGIDWNIFEEGLVISGADDQLICVWDIKQLSSSSSLSSNSKGSNNNNNNNNSTITNNALSVYKHHKDRVEDVSWHKKHRNIFGSVSDDHSIKIWDYRASKAPTRNIKDAHKGEINSISFSLHNENLFITGGADKIVALWDIRNTNTKLHSLEGHLKQIYQVEWCPQSEVHIASSGADRRVCIWDLSQIGMEQSAEDAEDGPPELFFTHGGHTDKVPDFSWNPNDPWVIASVADNNIVQVWQLTDELLTYDDITVNTQLE